MEWYNRADLLVYPTVKKGGFGFTIIEAMAPGVPVLVTEEGVAPEVVEEGVTGFFIKEEEDLVAGVRRLLEEGLEEGDGCQGQGAGGGL